MNAAMIETPNWKKHNHILTKLAQSKSHNNDNKEIHSRLHVSICVQIN